MYLGSFLRGNRTLKSNKTKIDFLNWHGIYFNWFAFENRDQRQSCLGPFTKLGNVAQTSVYSHWNAKPN